MNKCECENHNCDDCAVTTREDRGNVIYFERYCPKCQRVIDSWTEPK